MTTNVWSVTTGAPNVVHEVDPISRIEGHLGVKVVTDASGKIIDANAHGNLWRGFENFLLGREVNDAITFTQRICGVCPVPHGLTSTYAVDTVMGYSRGHITFSDAGEGSTGYGVPAKAVLIRNLVLGAEFLMSSITHFYHLAAPSYVQGPAMPPWTPFFDDSYYAPPLVNPDRENPLPRLSNTSGAPMALWDSVIYSYVKALKIRRLTFEAGSLFAGRMPMTSCFCGGGVTNDHTEDMTVKVGKFRALIEQVANFVISEYVPITLALGALPEYADFSSQGGTRGLGQGIGRFLSWGAFPSADSTGTLLFPGGVWTANTTPPSGFPAASVDNDVTHFRVINKAEVISKFLSGDRSVPTNLTEDIAHSRYGIADADETVYADSTGGSAPYPGSVSRTKPARESGYSYMKAPRWAGQACEVGPLARMVVAGYYPANGDNLIATFPAASLIYTSGGVLDASMISADVLAGLSNTNADGTVAYEAGNLAGIVTAAIPNMTGGLSVIDRVRARALESLLICVGILGTPTKTEAGSVNWPASGGWLGELAALGTAATWNSKTVPVAETQGWGGTEAPRGALMHQTTIKNGKITKYQCIVPTTWNGSPKDQNNVRGAIEQAMIDVPFGDDVTTSGVIAASATPISSTGGVNVLRVAQSFDPCIACAVH